MNSKTLNIVLGVLLIGALAFAIYAQNQLSEKAKEAEARSKESENWKKEVENWEKKYEEALIDMEDAFKRLEDKDNELKAALEEARKKGRK